MSESLLEQRLREQMRVGQLAAGKRLPSVWQ